MKARCKAKTKSSWYKPTCCQYHLALYQANCYHPTHKLQIINNKITKCYQCDSEIIMNELEILSRLIDLAKEIQSIKEII